MSNAVIKFWRLGCGLFLAGAGLSWILVVVVAIMRCKCK